MREVGRIMVRGGESLPFILYRSCSAAAAPISFLGTSMVLKGGLLYLAISILLTPITAISSGTDNPFSYIAFMATSAIRSLAANIAVGGFPLSSISRVAL